MHKKILAVLIIIIIAVIGTLGLMNGDSTADEVFEFSGFTVTCPPGSNYEEEGNIVEIFTEDSDEPALEIAQLNMTGDQYNQLIVAKHEYTNEELLNAFSGKISSEKDNSHIKVNSYNFTSFGNFSDIELDVTNGTQKYIYHIIKVTDNRIYCIIENLGNGNAYEIFNNLEFTT